MIQVVDSSFFQRFKSPQRKNTYISCIYIYIYVSYIYNINNNIYIWDPLKNLMELLVVKI